MDIQIRATITRNSNGSVDLRPVAGEPNPFKIDRLTIHTEGTPSAKDFPVDSEATISISSGVRSAELVSAPVAPSAQGNAPGAAPGSAPVAVERRAKR
jgi:hypothetical protein